MTKRLFCFGYGYTSDFLRALLVEEGGWRVAATTRDNEKRKALKSLGIESYLFDEDYPLDDPEVYLKDTTHILLSIPPDDRGDPVFLLHEEDICRLPKLEWIGYLSSTGVYGDRAGGVVDEEDELRPSSKRGSRRVKAERQWLSSMEERGIPMHIFRLAGIYGPGRSALDSVRAGIARRIFKPGQAFSRIHVEDIARILRASFDTPKPGEIYNLADDAPSPTHEVIAYACELMGREPPPLVPFEEADMAPMARSFYMDNKRVSNQRVKESLHYQFRYPTYKQGLDQIYKDENTKYSRDIGLFIE